MAKKLYVGNIPYEMTGAQLQEMFSKAGTVESANIIMDNFSGRSKGFSFVEMSTDEEAKKAIEMFNGFELSGRTLAVNEARPKTEHRDNDRGGYTPRHSGGYGGDRDRGRNSNRRDNRGGRGDRRF